MVTQSIDFTFLEGVDGWQFFASKFAAGVCEIDGVVYDRLSHIELVCEYDGAVGSAAYFDNISLVLDTGVSAKEYLCYPSTHVNSGLPMRYRSFQYYEYYEYNEDKQLSVLANSKGEMTEYFYDEDGRPTYEVTSDFYNDTNDSTYYPLYEVVYYGIPSTVDDLITKTPKSLTVYTYDDYGLMTSVTVYSPVFSDITQVTNPVEIGTTGYSNPASLHSPMNESAIPSMVSFPKWMRLLSSMSYQIGILMSWRRFITVSASLRASSWVFA